MPTTPDLPAEQRDWLQALCLTQNRIDLAKAIAQMSNEAIAEIYAMRAEGRATPRAEGPRLTAGRDGQKCPVYLRVK